jgi:hypothetical protein
VKPDEEDIYIKVSDAVQLLRELPPVNLQEPCEDCISRAEAKNCITRNEVRFRMIEELEALPSV